MNQSKKQSNLIESKQVNSFIEWFESQYNPGEKGENGMPRAAELTVKGIKGNIKISMVYEKDWLEYYRLIREYESKKTQA